MKVAAISNVPLRPIGVDQVAPRIELSATEGLL
jgi:hypothetical protein